MILELKTELAVRETPEGGHIRTSTDIHNHLKEAGSMAQECFCVLTLNIRNHLIKKHLVALGTLNQCLVHPREVFRPAIRDGAAAIIVAHTHPSGDPSPSTDDIAISKKLIDAGGVLDIEVLDHVIIGGDTCFSLREHGLAQFS